MPLPCRWLPWRQTDFAQLRTDDEVQVTADGMVILVR